MGSYVLDLRETAHLKPVYKKTDEDIYIFYDRKLYLVIWWLITVIFIIEGSRWWYKEGPDSTADLYESYESDWDWLGDFSIYYWTWTHNLHLIGYKLINTSKFVHYFTLS